MGRSRKVRVVFWWVVSLVLFAGAVLYVFQPFAVRRVDRVADSFLRAVFERDGKAFYEFLHPADKAELELTPEQCQRLLGEVILQKFRRCKVVKWNEPLFFQGYPREVRTGAVTVTLFVMVRKRTFS